MHQLPWFLLKNDPNSFYPPTLIILAQKECNRATIAVLKSRFGKDGVLFEDCVFDNGRVIIDTETSDTFLGYERKVEERKEQNARERIRMAKMRREQKRSESSQN